MNEEGWSATAFLVELAHPIERGEQFDQAVEHLLLRPRLTRRLNAMWMLYGQIGVFGLLFVLIAVACLPPTSPVKRWGASVMHPVANKRSQALLHEMLSVAEYQQVRSCGFLEVPSPSIEHRTYRIPSADGLVTVYEHDCLIQALCLQPTEPLPLADVVVMHKLLIEANEQEYLQQANHFAPHMIGTPP